MDDLLKHVAETALVELERSTETLRGIHASAEMCVRGAAAEMGVKPSVVRARIEQRIALHECPELTDRQWKLVAPIIGDTSYARYSRREVLSAILFVLCTGGAWSSIPFEYPPANVCHGQFLVWCERGVMDRIAAALDDSIPGLVPALAVRRLRPPPRAGRVRRNAPGA
ncbi:putative transposase of IS4/5 family DUF4096 [Paraburkholderia sp. BL17N1]|nr:putative transposase of IS4/5 family DUF4096 [Paraburkholderia sp. BL17N1]